MTWATTELKRGLAKFAQTGANGQAVLDLITNGHQCAPLECDQLDYKRQCNLDDIGLSEMCRDLVAFHNTYGGYLVIGVAEDEHERFEVVGSEHPIDLERLKNKLRDLTDERILVTQTQCLGRDKAGNDVSVNILFVPPRTDGSEPVRFTKDGPAKGNKGRPIFERGDIVFRAGDETRRARGAEVMEIWHCRPNPLLSEQGGRPSVPLSRIGNNLPDRNLICPQVVGRKDALDHLWSWLPDDLSHVKVLAGEGGIGKSSIAYEFSDQVTLLSSQPFAQLIWLSAKERQFRPFSNSYDEMVETHFGSYDELVERLCEHLAVTDIETEGASTTKKLKLIKQALSHLPSFIVIDDVDSLNESEQKQALEIGFILAGTQAKILLTTRKNVSYSQDICYTVRGLEEEEFKPFFDALMYRFPSSTRRTPKPSDIERIWSASKGSPLFAESILRLLDYQSVSEALKSWNGESGDEVRKAALLREIQQLLPEARRVLLALSLLSEASAAELAEVSGYPPDKISSAIQSLSSLFLVEAPKLGSESRIRVSETTGRLVLTIRDQLVTDHARLERAIRDFRASASGDHKGAGNKTVASAIMQALALERQEKIESAIETLRHTARRVTKDKSADLLAYMGHLFLKLPAPDYEASRLACRQAYQGGCTKRRLFESWFNAEWEAGNYPGAEEVARIAVERRLDPEYEWRIRLAAALQSKAHAQSSGRITLSVLPAHLEASEELSRAVRLAPRDEAHKWRLSLEDTNDAIYRALYDGGISGGSPMSIARQLTDFIRQGDIRIKNYTRVLDLLEAANGNQGQNRRPQHIDGWREVYGRLSDLLDDRVKRFPEDERHEPLIARLSRLQP